MSEIAMLGQLSFLHKPTRCPSLTSRLLNPKIAA